MGKRMQPDIDDQTKFWNDWNTRVRENAALETVSAKRAETVLRLLEGASLDPAKAAILEVGCGTGWFAERLSRFGRVTATDLADEVIARAKARYPGLDFVAGDFMTLPLPEAGYDAVITLETISHVPDQPAFFRKIARLLKPGGFLIATTQNRFVFERREDVMRQAKGQLRRWVSMPELKTLVRPRFRIRKATTIAPEGHNGILRLVNSPKLNKALSAAVSQATVDRWKESLGFGQTLVLMAQVKP